MVPIMGEEEGDDYESDFENEPRSSQITPNSQNSPFVGKRRIKSRSNARSNAMSNSAFSPKVMYSTQNRSQIGTAGGQRRSGNGVIVQSPWTNTQQ